MPRPLLPSAARYTDLIEQIYAAALDPRLWPAFLESLADAAGGAGSAFVSAHPKNPKGSLGVSVRLDPGAGQAYSDHFAAIDPWAIKGRASGLMRAGVALPSQAVIPHNEFVKTGFCSDFARRFDMVRGVCGVIFADGQSAAAISIYAPESGQPFDAPAVAVIEMLLPHLARALRIHERVIELDRDRVAFVDALDRLTCGVLLMNASGAITFANRSARDIVATDDGLSIRDHKLEASDQADARTLRRVLQGANLQRVADAQYANGAVRVARPSGKRSFVVVVAPLKPTEELLDVSLHRMPASAMVFVHDPEHQAQSSGDHLRLLYGLSHAELRVITALLTGERLDEIAERLCVSINTVRTHLRRIFAKTNTSRQAELLRVLLANQPPLRVD